MNYHDTYNINILSNLRQHNWASLRQTTNVPGGRRYVAKCYFKLLNMKSGHAYSSVEMLVADHKGKLLMSVTKYTKKSLASQNLVGVILMITTVEPLLKVPYN